MNLTVFEHDRQFVIDALRRGELDYLENVSEAAEANLFRHLIDLSVPKMSFVLNPGKFSTRPNRLECVHFERE